MKLLITFLALCCSLSAQMMQSITNAQKVPDPGTIVFTPSAGAVSNPTTVTFSGAATGSIYCSTQNGTTPATNLLGTACTTGSLGSTTSITSAVTVKVVSGLLGDLDSPVASAAYTISGGGTTWTVIQGTASATRNFTCTTTACSTSTITSTTAGDLEVVLWAGFGANASISPLTSNAVTGDSSFTECSNFPKQFNYGTNSYELIDCFYKLSATGGATSFTVTPTWNGGSGVNSQTQDVQFVQVRRSTGTATFDNANTSTNNTCTSNLCAAPTLSITGTADFCIQVIATASNPPTAIGGSYTGFFDSSNVFGGFAWNNSITSYSAPSWSVTTATPDGATAGVACWK